MSEPTVIPATEAAVATEGGMTGWSLLVPHHEDDAPVSEAVLLLTAFFVRVQRDQDFRDDLLDWFAESAS